MAKGRKQSKSHSVNSVNSVNSNDQLAEHFDMGGWGSTISIVVLIVIAAALGWFLWKCKTDATSSVSTKSPTK